MTSSDIMNKYKKLIFNKKNKGCSNCPHYTYSYDCPLCFKLFQIVLTALIVLITLSALIVLTTIIKNGAY